MPRRLKFRYKGEHITAKDMAIVLGITPNALRQRLRAGWTYKHEMLVCPKRKQREVGEAVIVSKNYDLNGGFTWDMGECGVVL